jgi:hypothetical protein
MGLGSFGKPAIITVKTESEAFGLLSLAKENGWHILTTVSDDFTEDLNEWELLRRGFYPPEDFAKTVKSNSPCICGSGRPFRKCCGKF